MRSMNSIIGFKDLKVTLFGWINREPLDDVKVSKKHKQIPLSSLTNQESINNSYITNVKNSILPLDRSESSSILYEKVSDGFDEEGLDIREYTLKDNTKRRNVNANNILGCSLESILAWFSMALAILFGSSIGPIFKYMESLGITPCRSAAWRNQAMFLTLAPIALIEVIRTKKQDRVEYFSVKSGLTCCVLGHIIFAGVAWAVNLNAWIIGLYFTTTFRASLISSSHPLILVIVLRVRGVQVSYLEVIGVMTSLLGIIFVGLPTFFNEQKSIDISYDAKYELLGYLLCFISAGAEYTALTTLVNAVLSSIASILFESSNIDPISGNLDLFCVTDNCVFGWVSKKWIIRMLIFGLVIGVLCIAGFNYAMQHIPPLIFSSLSLLDPALTAIISWLCGLESLPSLFTWLGGCVTMSGVGLISIGDHHRHKRENTNNSHSNDSKENKSDRIMYYKDRNSNDSIDGNDIDNINNQEDRMTLVLNHDEENHTINNIEIIAI
eukprot:gene7676-10445_t